MRLSIFLLILLLAGCVSNKKKMVGVWKSASNNTTYHLNSFRLAPNGEAYTHASSHIELKKWRKKGKNLILEGKEQVGPQFVEFIDTLHIHYITRDSLVTTYKKRQLVFIK